jgi:hypothetical protein
MALLAGTCYDPAVAVTKATSALLAMTALDTTNLRLVFTVPASGCVLVRQAGVIHGATTFPQILIGVLQSTTVIRRVAPSCRSVAGTALATTQMPFEATFCMRGLTPSASLTWDAAYGVEVILAATGIKYGGPNDTTTNNAFGGYCFEIWEA